MSEKFNLSKEEVDALGRDRYARLFGEYEKLVKTAPTEELKAALRLKVKDSLVVGAPVDIFGDGVVYVCACGAKLWVRPWLDALVKKYDLLVWCPQDAWAMYEDVMRGEFVKRAAEFSLVQERKASSLKGHVTANLP